MPPIQPQNPFASFLAAAAAYRATPGLMTALDLNEKASRARHACYTELKDESLGWRVEALLAALRGQDEGAALALLEEIGSGLEAHGITPP